MADASEHYEELLAPVYVWMIGGIDAATARSRALFEQLEISPRAADGRRALDIGCGPGPQSLALADAGYAVTAIDPSPTLIDTLRAEADRRARPVTTACDGAPLGDRHLGPFDVVTCMTDTLVTLPDVDAARGVIDDAARRLAPGGRLILTWRDLRTLPEGDARFLLVRSSPERVLTCFLEPIDARRVRVHDLLHERDGEGFTQRVSSYAKLRLGPDEVDGWLRDAGLDVERRDRDAGMEVRVARRPR